ncbi:TonB-dependent receptor domain-containing protein [Chryseobacterium sp.]|uniref:TonB-dependent receptor domain-containing protein n=1 Tax=Chryseobacterium sp. TaxID=1871047 RepID=UPI0028969067|nr:TonB-dependent receptor [Chryseobacterium sp.]
MKAKKITIMIILMFCILQNTVTAQVITTVIIKGRVLNRQTQLPLENALISLSSVQNPDKKQSSKTNKSGAFEMQTEAGEWNISIDFSTFKPVTLNNQSVTEDLDLGDFFLNENYQLLETVTVSGEKSGLSLNLDKKVFYTGKDLLAKGGSANDVLNNVPSVSVDVNGAVSLRGNSGVRILIDGKPSVISLNNGLEQIPASQIEKIEVITNPSAKYEAQGNAGIINIILKKNTLSGLNSSIQAGVGDPANYNGNINFSYKKEKFNLFGNIGTRFRNLHIKEDRNQTTLKNGVKNLLLQNNMTNRRDQAYNFYVGGDYYINDKNTLTGSFYHSTLIINNHIDYEYNYFNQLNVQDSLIHRYEHYREPKKYNQLELNYVKNFEQKGKTWTTSLRYDFWNDDENQNINQYRLLPSQVSAPKLVTRNIESSNDIFVQSDYVYEKNNSKLEAGIRGDFRAIKSDYQTVSDDILLQQYNNKLNYNENLVGAYMQWVNKINKWSYLLGLRSELSIIRISDRAGIFTNNKQYIDFFPTAHLGYALKENTTLQLSYSRRIDRPGFWQLNPFGGLSDLRNLTIGNPDLNPTYTHSLEFSVLSKINKFTITPSVYYKNTANYFQYVLQQTEDGNFLRTPVNLDHEERYGLEVSSTYKPFGWWNLALNFNYYGFRQQGKFEGKEYGSKDEMWTAQLNSRMKLPKNLAIESVFTYRSSFQDIQSVNKPVYKLNVAVSKDLFKEKMTLSIAFNNIFNSLIERQELNTPDYQLQSTAYGVGRIINLTATYRFNRKKGDKDRLPEEN